MRPWASAACGPAVPNGRSVIRVTAPTCPASTSDLATAWMAVVKSEVRPRQATFEMPMLPAHRGKPRRPTGRTRPAAPVLGEKTLLFLAGEQERSPAPGPCSSRPRDHLPRHQRVARRDRRRRRPARVGAGAYSSAARAVSPARSRFVPEALAEPRNRRTESNRRGRPGRLRPTTRTPWKFASACAMS